jgi:hypothetical protein
VLFQEGTAFLIAPGWLTTVIRHWNLDRPDPRERVTGNIGTGN